MDTLALLCGQPVSRLADGDKTNAISHATGVGTAAVTVTLEGWRRKRQSKKKGRRREKSDELLNRELTHFITSPPKKMQV